MPTAEVIDPTVVRIALEHVASVATLLIMTEAIVADQPKRSGKSEMADMDDMM